MTPMRSVPCNNQLLIYHNISKKVIIILNIPRFLDNKEIEQNVYSSWV